MGRKRKNKPKQPRQIDQKTFQIINKIAKEHSKKNKEFGYLNGDDLKNEIWAICLERIGEFDEEHGKLENFLRVVVKNRLINRFKDITKSVKSPCPKCPYYDKGGSPSDCAMYGDDRHLCDKWNTYQITVDSRNSLLNAMEPQIERYDFDANLDRLSDLEIQDKVYNLITDEYKRDFKQILNGETISKQKLKRLRKEVERVLPILESKNFVVLTIKGEDYA